MTESSGSEMDASWVKHLEGQSVLIILALLLAQASASYIYHIPVNVLSLTEPAVLMPGDTAVLSIDLQNGAAQYGADSETLNGTLSTPMNDTSLRGTNEIAIISPDYKDIGMIGPTDKIPSVTRSGLTQHFQFQQDLLPGLRGFRE